MAYMQELDAWLDGLFTELADQNISFAETKKAIREKVLESYRNGQKAEEESPAPKPAKGRGEKKQAGKPQRFAGNWQCAKCGGAITSLPFEPKGDSANRLQCLECYKARLDSEE